MKAKTIKPIDITIEELGPYRNDLKKYTITHEFKGRGGDSQMTIWLWELQDDHKIILAKQDGKIIGWAVGAPYIDEFNRRIFNKHTCLVGIYILKDHRKKGYGFQLGQHLFTLIKSQGFHRIYMNFRTKGASSMYRKLCEYIGTKRQPFTPPSENLAKDWKIVKL